MGDEIVVVDMQFIYGYLWQIDLLNKNKNEQTRIFVTDEELQKRMSKARESEET